MRLRRGNHGCLFYGVVDVPRRVVAAKIELSGVSRPFDRFRVPREDKDRAREIFGFIFQGGFDGRKRIRFFAEQQTYV